MKYWTLNRWWSLKISHDFCVSLHQGEGEGSLYQVMVLITYVSRLLHNFTAKFFTPWPQLPAVGKEFSPGFNFALVFFTLFLLIGWLVLVLWNNLGRPGAFPLYEAGASHCNTAAVKAVTFNQFWPCWYSSVGDWSSFYSFVFLPSCSSFSNFYQP